MGWIVLAGLMLGLASNFHCLGMCGPIALAVPVNRKNNWTILGGALQYNLGRILIYSVLGVIIGSIGITINTFGILQWLSIIAGAGLILYAWKKYFTIGLSNVFPKIGLNSFLNKYLGTVIRSKSPFRLLFLGSINGLLPCGMVYVALLNALTAGDLLGSGLAMTAFGLGTLPAMMLVVFLANRITTQTRIRMNKAIPYLLTVVGVLIVLRGLNLNIPYISPSIKLKTQETIKTEKNTSENQPEVEMSCCHKGKKCD